MKNLNSYIPFKGVVYLISVMLIIMSASQSVMAAQPRIEAGIYHSLALKADNTLWAWGDNGNGDLGDGTNVNKNVPTKIGTDTDWAQVTAGFHHSLGMKTDGNLWAWGRNDYGQLGDGTTVYSNLPIIVFDLCLFDTDDDGIYDDGDNSCSPVDNPCTGGNTVSCDDNCPTIENPEQEDVDSDGIGDLCDECPNDPANDIDTDSVCGDVDNCPYRYNPAQTDWDNDNVGDTCDTETQDNDGDGVDNRIDNCESALNFYQLDADNDTIGDVCDNTPGCGGCGQPDCEPVR